MKKYMGLLFTVLFLLGGQSSANAGPTETIINSQLEQLDTTKIDGFWNQLVNQYRGFLPETNSPSIFQMIISSEDKGFSLSNVIGGLLRFIFHEILINGKLLGMIIILTIFALILENIQNAFENSTVSKVAFAITYLVLMILAINSFYVAINYAKAAIQGMMDFMLALVPLLLTLLASMGNFTSVALFHPFIIFMVNMSGTIIYYVIFPLIFFSTLLNLVSTISERYKLTRLAVLLKQIGVGILGAFLTIFLGVLSVQGAATSITDGVTVRTAKYLTGNFVPVVGKMFSDASDTVIGASLLLKNGVGIVGVVIILFLAAFPALKIIALAIIYQISAAVLQPLGSNPIISTLSMIGNALIFIFAALATVSLMFFLSITIIVTAANLSVMVR